MSNNAAPGANIARLRAGVTGAMAGNASFMIGCATMLEALHAFSEKRADAAVYSNRLDSLMRTGRRVAWSTPVLDLSKAAHRP